MNKKELAVSLECSIQGHTKAIVERDAALARADVLEKALRKADAVLRNVSELYHPKYLLHTDTLFKEIQNALATPEPTEAE